MKKHPGTSKPALSISSQERAIGGLLASLREIIRTARQQAVRAVDVVQVRTCWSVGRHIVEFEQGGAARAAYGKRLLANLVVCPGDFDGCHSEKRSDEESQAARGNTRFLTVTAFWFGMTTPHIRTDRLLAENLTAEFGKGFDERNLRHMRRFYTNFPIWNALRSELSWTHYRSLMQVEDADDAEDVKEGQP